MPTAAETICDVGEGCQEHAPTGRESRAEEACFKSPPPGRTEPDLRSQRGTQVW